MSKLGEILAELRRDKGLRQRDLAELLHVTPGTISNYEKNVHLPDVEKLIDLANYFHVTTDYLLGRCESNLSVDVFHEIVAEKKTIGELIQELRQLPEDRKEALLLIINDIGFCAAINRYNKKERQ